MADKKLNNLIDFKNYTEKEMNKPAKKTKRTETGKDIINEHHKETTPEKVEWICKVVNQLTDDDVNYLYDMIEDHISEGNIGNLEMLNENKLDFFKSPKKIIERDYEKAKGNTEMMDDLLSKSFKIPSGGKVDFYKSKKENALKTMSDEEKFELLSKIANSENSNAHTVYDKSTNKLALSTVASAGVGRAENVTGE